MIEKNRKESQRKEMTARKKQTLRERAIAWRERYYWTGHHNVETIWEAGFRAAKRKS